jgi:hypothetical protein
VAPSAGAAFARRFTFVMNNGLRGGFGGHAYEFMRVARR